MYRIDVLVQGFPGKAVCHGGLGWSTIALLRSDRHTILIDVGAFGIRKPLEQQLKAAGVTPADITDVVLTHAHYDHSVNYVLFDRATVWIGAKEMAWAAAQPRGFDPLPELYVQALATDPRVKRIHEGEEFLPGIAAFDAPGHTPGSLVFHLTANEVPVIFTGDAAKNRAELLSRTADMTASAEQTAQSMAMIWEFWRRRPGNILVPGHDLPMTQKDGRPSYLGKREAAISTWYGDDLEQTTLFELSRERAGAILAADD